MHTFSAAMLRIFRFHCVNPRQAPKLLQSRNAAGGKQRTKKRHKRQRTGIATWGPAVDAVRSWSRFSSDKDANVEHILNMANSSCIRPPRVYNLAEPKCRDASPVSASDKLTIDYKRGKWPLTRLSHHHVYCSSTREIRLDKGHHEFERDRCGEGPTDRAG